MVRYKDVTGWGGVVGILPPSDEGGVERMRDGGRDYILYVLCLSCNHFTLNDYPSTASGPPEGELA